MNLIFKHLQFLLHIQIDEDKKLKPRYNQKKLLIRP